MTSSATRTELVVLAAILGLLIGSFLNVVIWRVPRKESVARPPSHCPRCGTRLAVVDNIPVVSWLILRGRCRTCRESISIRYPAVELLTAVLWVLMALRFSPTHAQLAVLPAALWLTSLGVALAAIDLDTQRLPDVLTLPAYPVSAALLLAAVPAQHDGWSPVLRIAVGGAAGWAFFFAIRVATGGKGMGFGDVKLSGILGMHLGLLGWKVTVVGFFGAFLLGGVLGIVVMLAGKGGRKTRIPFGPFLIAGTLLALLQGHELAQAWLGSGA